MRRNDAGKSCSPPTSGFFRLPSLSVGRHFARAADNSRINSRGIEIKTRSIEAQFSGIHSARRKKLKGQVEAKEWIEGVDGRSGLFSGRKPITPPVIPFSRINCGLQKFLREDKSPRLVIIAGVIRENGFLRKGLVTFYGYADLRCDYNSVEYLAE